MHRRPRPDEILSKLRSAGFRLTAARRAVIEALATSGPHPSADDIAVLAGQINPDVHRSTVYRTLDALAEIDVVSHVHLGHGGAVYHLADDTDIHLVCRRCDALTHVDARLFESASEAITSATGFAVDLNHFALSGLCPSCQAAPRPAPGSTAE